MEERVLSVGLKHNVRETKPENFLEWCCLDAGHAGNAGIRRVDLLLEVDMGLDLILVARDVQLQ